MDLAAAGGTPRLRYSAGRVDTTRPASPDTSLEKGQAWRCVRSPACSPALPFPSRCLSLILAHPRPTKPRNGERETERGGEGGARTCSACSASSQRPSLSASDTRPARLLPAASSALLLVSACSAVRSALSGLVAYTSGRPARICRPEEAGAVKWLLVRSLRCPRSGTPRAPPPPFSLTHALVI
jgi:hypothetical protein